MKRWIKSLFIAITLLVILCNYKQIKSLIPTNREANAASTDEEFTMDIVYDSAFDDAVINKVEAAIQSLPIEKTKAFAERGWKLVIVSKGNNKVDYETKTLWLLANENIETVLKDIFEDLLKGQSNEA